MANPSTEIKIEWIPEPGACRPCHVCEDQIYGSGYVMYVAGIPAETILCASCYKALDE